METKGPALSKNVIKWPEFKALMDRLGVDVHPSVLNIEIKLHIKSAVVITQSHNGIEVIKETKG